MTWVLNHYEMFLRNNHPQGVVSNPKELVGPNCFFRGAIGFFWASRGTKEWNNSHVRDIDEQTEQHNRSTKKAKKKNRLSARTVVNPRVNHDPLPHQVRSSNILPTQAKKSTVNSIHTLWMAETG